MVNIPLDINLVRSLVKDEYTRDNITLKYNYSFTPELRNIATFYNNNIEIMYLDVLDILSISSPYGYIPSFCIKSLEYTFLDVDIVKMYKLAHPMKTFHKEFTVFVLDNTHLIHGKDFASFPS